VAEPVTLAEAKAQVRMIEDDSQDAFIESLIAPARAYVERVSTYGLVAGNRIFTFTRWGDYLEIYLRPITSVTTVAYVDEDGNDEEYGDYLAPLGAFPFRIFPAVSGSFPTIADGSTITVTLVAGALDSASQQYLIAKRAILLLIGHWFETREGVVIGQASNEVDLAVHSLLDTISPLPAY
jgi:uncharacterized phiE125 gp8 family phage protein